MRFQSVKINSSAPVITALSIHLVKNAFIRNLGVVLVAITNMIHPRHAILMIAAAASSSLAAEQAAGSTSYDYLLFVQQWPPTECMSGSCKNSSIDFFTVHGALCSVTSSNL